MVAFSKKMRYTRGNAGLTAVYERGYVNMGAMNDLTEKSKEVASVVIDKAKTAAELVKINVAIAGEQKEIDKNCLAIGQWFISDYDGEIPEGIRELVDAVNASKAKIAELEAAKPAKDAPEAAEETEESAGKPCPICGEVSNNKFCPHCGAPMGD